MHWVLEVVTVHAMLHCIGPDALRCEGRYVGAEGLFPQDHFGQDKTRSGSLHDAPYAVSTGQLVLRLALCLVVKL